MDFDEYQHSASTTDQNIRPADDGGICSCQLFRHEVIPLLGLVGEVGGLLGEYKKMLRDGATHRRFRDEVAEELGDILWYVANLATKYDLSLGAIARQNLLKVQDRWRRAEMGPRYYDADLPQKEQLPRNFEYSFEQRLVAGNMRIALVDRLSGCHLGDPLTDNAYEDDGYRFHDVLHLGLAACLAWSPVLRKLLRTAGQLEHRTPRGVDEVEDGGRAQVIEEAIVATAYAYASNHDFLEGVHAVDWKLLRHIKELTAHVEVCNRTTKEWNDALLRGFAVWRQLRDHEGGAVRGDLCAGTIEFVPSNS